MHMSDALISPLVGGFGWLAAAGLTAHAARQVRRQPDESSRAALMGVLGAFVFAAQMVNFAIPGTGSSGHIGGGLLLSAILGPHAALVVMASVLTVQALFFADGGLLALGCNIVNLGLFTCYVAYPLVFRPLAGASPTRGRLTGAALVAAVFGLTLGALAVVVETTFSGVSQLPFGPFALVMVPIHAAIGVVEGIVTAGVVLFVWRARPDLLRLWDSSSAHGSLRALLITFAAVAVVLGAVVSRFASTQPDGLEWSLGRVAGTEAPAGPERSLRGLLTRLQKRTAILPDYSLRSAAENPSAEGSWPAPDAGASLSGVLGAGLTLLVALGAGYGLHRARSRNRADPPTRTS